MIKPHCPACRSNAVVDLGGLPDAVDFAGAERDVVFQGGRLWRCQICELRFRHPRLSDERLEALYREGSHDAWVETAERRVDWKMAREFLILTGVSGNILDVGCWDGRFLHGLEELPLKPFGIEINAAAASRAAEGGITLLGDNLRNLGEAGTQFQAITAFDVVEHVAQPMAFLGDCARALAPGGYLLLATGNAQSPPFRLLGTRHLYCIWPEHLVFISPSWLRWAAPQVGLRVFEVTTYRRSDSGPVDIAADWLKNSAYRLAPGLFPFLRRRGVGRPVHPVKEVYPPQWPSARDHILAVLQRASQ